MMISVKTVNLRTKPAMAAVRFVMWCFLLGFLTLDSAVGEVDRPCDPKSEFQCVSLPRLCIPLDRVRDGKPDCPDLSDEECTKIEFKCKDDSGCVPQQWVQDGWEDCADGSDEDCLAEQHRCGCGELKCIDKNQIKDGVEDCLDGSDEGATVDENCQLLQEQSLTKERQKRQTGGAQTEYPRRRNVRVRPEATPTQYDLSTEEGGDVEVPPPYEQSANFQFLRLSGRNGPPENPGNTPDVESPSYDHPNTRTGGPRRSVLRRVRPTDAAQRSGDATRSSVIRRTRTRHYDEATETPTPVPITTYEEPLTLPPSESLNEAVPTTDRDVEPETSSESLDNEHIDESGRRGPSPVRRVIRLRRPEASSSNQRKRVLVSRRLVNGQTSESLQARGPVTGADNALEDQEPKVDHEAYTTEAVPVTYLTTYTYYTTFLHGINTVYTSREAVISTVETQTINPDTAKVIQSYGGYTSDPNGESIIHLGSRVFGPTTTVVNLASRIQLFNDDIFSGIYNSAPFEEATPIRDYSSVVPTQVDSQNLYQTRHASELASLPKTYYTLYTYYYTFYDGLSTRQSVRAETVSNVPEKDEAFITQSANDFIDSQGLLTVGPDTKIIPLGSRDVAGTTTEVNLGMRTLIHFDGISNVVVERPSNIQPTQSYDQAPSTYALTDNTLPDTPPQYGQPQRYNDPVLLQPSYSSEYGKYPDSVSNSAYESTPDIVGESPELSTQPIDRRPFRVVSSLVQQSGGILQSRPALNRPGVRVRVRPVSSRRIIAPSSAFGPSVLASDQLLDSNIYNRQPIATDNQGLPENDPNQGTPNLALDGSFLSGYPNILPITEQPQDLGDQYGSYGGRQASPPEEAGRPGGRRRLKITVRRPNQTGNATSTNTRFVRPSRFEITTKPRIYVVTRTGPVRAVRPSKQPVSVKIGRRPKPGEEDEEFDDQTGVISYETYTTLTTVPVIFGLETSYRSVLLTTSSAVLVPEQSPSYAPSVADLQPTRAVVYTYYTTTTYTVPFTVGDQTLLTTLEETNSRIVTQTYDPEPQIGTAAPAQFGPAITSYEFGYGGPTTHIINSAYDGSQTSTILYPGPDGIPRGTKIIRTDPNGAGFTSMYGSVPENIIPSTVLNPTPQTLPPIQVFGPGFVDHVSSKPGYITRVSDGVTLILASDSDIQPSPSTALTLRPSIVTDAVHMKDKEAELNPSFSVFYNTRTFYTTYTYFTTFFTDSTSVIKSSEQVVSNVVAVPVTQIIELTTTPTPPAYTAVAGDSATTIVETSERLVTSTARNTFTIYATLFNGSSSFVTPLEEVHTQVYTITEPFTFTRVITPTPTVSLPAVSSEIAKPESYEITSTLYTTYTNFITLFQGTDTVISSIEETASSVATLTLFGSRPTELLKLESSPVVSSQASVPLYTTRTFLTTQTHYITLFSGSETILSSIEEVGTQVATERIEPTPVIHVSVASTPLFSRPVVDSDRYNSYGLISSSIAKAAHESVQLHTSLRTLYTTYTFYTTYLSDTATLISSREETSTSYVTLFVPQSVSVLQSPKATFDAPEIAPSSTASVSLITTTGLSTLTLYTTLFNGGERIVISSEHVVPGIITATITPSLKEKPEPTSTYETVHTQFTTYTFYDTYVSGSETLLTPSESVITNYITATETGIRPQPTTTAHFSPPSSHIVNVDTRFETSVGEDRKSEIRTEFGQASSSSSSVDEGASHIIIGGQSIDNFYENNQNSDTLLSGTSTTVIDGSTVIFFTDFMIPHNVAPSVSSSSTTETTESTKLTTPHIPETTAFTTNSDATGTEPTTTNAETPTLPEEVENSLTTAITSTIVVSSSSQFVGLNKETTKLRPNATLLMITGTDGEVTRLTHAAAIIPYGEEIKPSDPLLDIDLPFTTIPPPTSKPTIKPGSVIELSDLLGGNANLGGNIGEAIKGIVNLITSQQKNDTKDEPKTEKDQPPLPPREGVTISRSEEPVYIPIGAIGRESEISEVKPIFKPIDTIAERTNEKPDIPTIFPSYSSSLGETFSPGTLIKGFTPLPEDSSSAIDRDSEKPKFDISGSKVVGLVPTKSPESGFSPIYDSSTKLQGSLDFENGDSSSKKATPSIQGTSVITGAKTIFLGNYGRPNTRTSDSTTKFTRRFTSRPFGVPVTVPNINHGTDFTPLATSRQKPASNGYTTITKDGQTIVSKTSSGATTIFYPQGNQPPQDITTAPDSPSSSTKYVTRVESLTRTLTLTTTKIYYTRDSPITITSVFTTTIPPRTFVSTIVGSRTILGSFPEPTETVQIQPSVVPSESTTTVTTTTKIFNDITTTFVRTLVIPTKATKVTSGSQASVINEGKSDVEVVEAGTERPPGPPQSADSTSIQHGSSPKFPYGSQTTPRSPLAGRRPVILFKPGSRPIESTTAKPAFTGIKPKLSFPTRPPSTTTEASPVRPSSPRPKFRPGGTREELDIGCYPDCDAGNKEICKSNDSGWSCECRPGFARKNASTICEEIQTYVVSLRVVKMGESAVSYRTQFSNSLSSEFQEFAEIAKKGIAEAYKSTDVSSNYIAADVESISDGKDLDASESDNSEGVVVKFRLQVSKDPSVGESQLKEELSRSLKHFNFSVGGTDLFVNPQKQTVEDVQDFDECNDEAYNDCAKSAICTNIPGSYNCTCNEHFQDMDSASPGRICSGEIKACDFCNGRGDCLVDDFGKRTCKCNRMYIGRKCEINGLVLAIALPLAAGLVIFLVCCLFCCCRRYRRHKSQRSKAANVFKGMGLINPLTGTLDKKAMIMDTSSESSGDHQVRPPPPPPPPHAFDGFSESDMTPKKGSKKSDLSLDRSLSTGFSVPPVMIPRARHQHPKQVNYPNMYGGQAFLQW